MRETYRPIPYDFLAFKKSETPEGQPPTTLARVDEVMGKVRQRKRDEAQSLFMERYP